MQSMPCTLFYFILIDVLTGSRNPLDPLAASHHATKYNLNEVLDLLDQNFGKVN